MQQHPDQRVGIFVDVQNMYYCAKNLYNAKVNFSVVLKTAVGRRRLVRAIAYTIKADMKDESSFHEALSNLGYEVKLKELQTFHTGAKKGDWDMGIAIDMIKLAPKLDTVILVSGDGDFRVLLEHVRAMGCRTEVMSFGKTTNAKLKEEVDQFIDMDHNNRRFLIPLK